MHRDPIPAQILGSIDVSVHLVGQWGFPLFYSAGCCAFVFVSAEPNSCSYRKLPYICAYFRFIHQRNGVVVHAECLFFLTILFHIDSAA